MKCLLLINTSSGNAAKALASESLRTSLSAMYEEIEECHISEADRDTFDLAKKLEGFGALAVCGGDGTFNTTINAVRGLDIDLLYIPCGTFNDAAHTLKSLEKLDDLKTRRVRKIDLGEFNDTLFSYVAAAGSFTAIGFLPKSKYKKRFKRLVYYLYAFKEYRVHRMPAEVLVNGKTYKDTYTLIMAVKSKYVFGLPFNKRYRHNNGKGHLLLIRTPRGPFKWLSLFFLFFRAFFVGFRKEHFGKRILFVEFENAALKLDGAYEFCVDGERLLSKKENTLRFHKQKTKMFVGNIKG